MGLSASPQVLLQTSLLSLGMALSLSSENVLGVWLGVELKMFSILPLLMNKPNMSLTYFVVQTLGTTLFLFGVSFPEVSMLTFLGLLMKLGVLPYYMWFVEILYSSKWPLFFILATAQKIHLLMLASSYFTPTPQMLYLVVYLSMIVVSLHCLFELVNSNKQISTKSIMAFLAMIDGSVLLLALNNKLSMGLVYFANYSFILFCLVISLSLLKKSFWSKGAFTLSVLSLSGFPPFMGFWLKISLLVSLFVGPFNISYLVFGVVLVIQFLSYLVVWLSKMQVEVVVTHTTNLKGMVFFGLGFCKLLVLLS